MNRSLRIAWREYVATVCTKGFILGLVLAPLMMGGSMLGIAVMNRQTKVTDRDIVVIDRSGFLAEAILKAAENRNQAQAARKPPGPAYRVTVTPVEPADLPIRRLELSDRIRSGRLHAFVEIGAHVLNPAPDSDDHRLHYHALNPAMDEVRDWMANILNDRLRHERLRAAGIDPSSITNLFAWAPLVGMGLVERDARTGTVQAARRQNEATAIALPLGVAVFAMLLIMMGAAPLLQSVMEEKNLRIAEVMLGVATPWELMLGKVLGGVAVSFTAMAVYLGVGATGFVALAASQAIPWKILFWFVAYVVSAILMYGAVAAALGSACSDSKDAQNLQLPLILPVMIPMFLILPVIKEPQSTLATGLSFVPPFTPLLMLLRLSAPGGIPAWQPWVGLVLVLLATAFALWLGGRIFRVGILMQGKPPRFLDILRWGFRG